MPEVSRFYGIAIRLYYRDHPPSHFHAIYRGHDLLFEIETDAIDEGHLPGSAYDLVSQWRAIHVQELRSNWDRAREQLPLLPIAPLE